MSTYDNLNIATTTLTFTGEGDSSVGTRTFDLSTLQFLPDVPLIDQIEIERIFDTGVDSKFEAVKFTIADRREMFILPKTWYSINENTKILTVLDLSTIPTFDQNGLLYPNSRTYRTSFGTDINIPVLQNTTTSTPSDPNNPNSDPIIRQFDTVLIRRKTLSKESIVTFAPGTRLTTTQLNLQFNQLKFIVQELLAKVKNESILKYDENAVDGPFLGNTDLRMSNNYIKDLGQVLITQKNSNPSNEGSVIYPGGGFAVNVNSLHHAVVNGTVYRSGLANTTPALSGNFTASSLKISNLGAATLDTDAAQFGQIRDATNLIYGTLSPDRIATNSLPLTKLQTTNGGNYVLPASALPTSGVNAGTYGQNSATNSNNMLQIAVDNKGRITGMSHRTLLAADLPNTAVTAGVYGNSPTTLVQLTVDAQGRITNAQERAISASDITQVDASTVTLNTLPLSALPTTNVQFSGTMNIPNQITVDSRGRVTNVTGGSITASNVSDFTSAATTVTQNNAVYWDNGASVFTAAQSGTNRRISNIASPTAANDAVTKGYMESNTLTLSANGYNASNQYISNIGMRSTPAAGDGVNFGFIQGLVLQQNAVGSTQPQTYNIPWSSFTLSANTPAGYDRYQYTFTDLTASTSEMMILQGTSGSIVFIPQASATAGNGHFFLDTTGSNKVLSIWLTAGATPTNNVVIRNFGLSRLVSSDVATTSGLGIVSIVSGLNGGIAVTPAGAISLQQASSTQLGGMKAGTGLIATSGVITPDFSDSTSLANSNKVASSAAVNSLRLASMLLDGTQTMTGKLTTRTASSTTTASLSIPVGSTNPTTLVAGDIWNNGGTLKYYTGSTTKDIAFTDDSITGTASAWTTGRTIAVTGDVTGTSPAITGASNVTGWSLTTNPATNVKSIVGTANQITATKNNTTGAVTLNLPQDIHTSATPTFSNITTGGLGIGTTGSGVISGSALTIDTSTMTTNSSTAFTMNGNLTVNSNTITLGDGSSTINFGDNVTFTTTSPKINLGTAQTTAIARAGAAVSGVAAVGDLYFRVPTGGKAFLIANTTNTTNPIADNKLITSGELNTTLGNYATTATTDLLMDKTGTVVTGSTTQTIGTTTGLFAIKTNGANRLTINSGGTVAITGAATIGTTLSVTGKATSDNTLSTDGGTTLTTKNYVDTIKSIVGVMVSKTQHTTPTNSSGYHGYNNRPGNSDQWFSTQLGTMYSKFSGGTFTKTRSNSDLLIEFPPIQFLSYGVNGSGGKPNRLIVRVTLTKGTTDYSYDIPIFSGTADIATSTYPFVLNNIQITSSILNTGTYNWDIPGTISSSQFYNTTTQSPQPGDPASNTYGSSGTYTLKSIAVYAWIDIMAGGAQSVQFAINSFLGTTKNIVIYEVY